MKYKSLLGNWPSSRKLKIPTCSKAIQSLILIGLNVLFVSLSSIAQDKMVFIEGKIICDHHSGDCDLSVYFGIHDFKPKHQPQISGAIDSDNRRHIFSPTLAFSMGQTYTAFCKDQRLVFAVDTPEDYDCAIIKKIYPTGKVLPANQLKFYIQFSKPMSALAYPHFDLLDSKGQIIERALLKEIPELWNEDRTRLCIWIEPGRIKQGLGPNQKLGPVLETGEKYTLQVSTQMRDENGVFVKEGASKNFLVTSDDRRKPDIRQWSCEAPSSNTKKPLVLQFSEPLDMGSTLSNLEIQYENGDFISGNWAMGKEERSAVFYPDAVWRTGQYRILVDAVIEDLAGNNLHRLFDHEIGEELSEKTIEFFVEFMIATTSN